jgi:hypothetical protein
MSHVVHRPPESHVVAAVVQFMMLTFAHLASQGAEVGISD